GLQGYRPPYSF
nr:immunoglobulin light chain junction region [Macaca mulatta]